VFSITRIILPFYFLHTKLTKICAFIVLNVNSRKAPKFYSSPWAPFVKICLLRKHREAFRRRRDATSVARRTQGKRKDYEADERICSQRMVGPTFQWPRPETVWPKGSERAAAMACCRLMLDEASGWRLSPKKDALLLHSSETVDGPRAA